MLNNSNILFSTSSNNSIRGCDGKQYLFSKLNSNANIQLCSNEQLDGSSINMLSFSDSSREVINRSDIQTNIHSCNSSLTNTLTKIDRSVTIFNERLAKCDNNTVQLKDLGDEVPNSTDVSSFPTI